MEPSTDPHNNAWPLTEELFAIPFAPDILLFLRGKQGCSKEDLKGAACDGKNLEKAMEFLAGKGLAEVEDGQVRLTAKGEKAAEIIDRIEKLLWKASDDEGA